MSGRSYATQVFQGCLASILFYGDNFYVRRRATVDSALFSRTMLLSVPLHVIFLAAVFWSDRAFPQLMTKAVVFIPVLAVGFVMESVLINKIAGRLWGLEIERTQAR
jgi:uncharacterized membrane protein YwzB